MILCEACSEEIWKQGCDKRRGRMDHGTNWRHPKKSGQFSLKMEKETMRMRVRLKLKRVDRVGDDAEEDDL